MTDQSLIAIAPMTEEDLRRVLEIQSESYYAVAPESAASIRAKLTASPTTCFVARSGGEVCGYLIALPWTSGEIPALNCQSCTVPDAPDCLYLHDLAVSAAARSLGVGRSLIQRFLELAQSLELSRCTLIAVQNSANFWRGFGFESREGDFALHDEMSGYGEGATYMELHLRGALS